jgi:dTDP-4-amino-4,6-dideoxygalactose transaminase
MNRTAVRTIPFFNYPALFARQREEILGTVERVFAAGKLIMQEDLEEFEANLARYLGVKHAFGVGNGTDGLLIALLAAGVRKGDEVILPSHTFIATGAAVHHSGAIPVLADCRDDHLIDPAAVRGKVTKRTKAIVPVQLNGRTCDMDALQAIATEHNLVIVEDAAQGLGSDYNGQKAGTFGRAAMFSFYPAKVLGCFGDGGGVVTNDDRVAERIKTLRNHGRMDDGDVSGWCFNSRLDNLQAALLDLKLKSFPEEVSRRREIAGLYQQRLAAIVDLRLPPAPRSDPRHFDVYQNYEVEAHRRDELRNHLKANGVNTILQWGGKALHHFPALGFKVDLPVTERIIARSFLLPMNTSLKDDDVFYICDLIDAFYRG